MPYAAGLDMKRGPLVIGQWHTEGRELRRSLCNFDRPEGEKKVNPHENSRGVWTGLRVWCGLWVQDQQWVRNWGECNGWRITFSFSGDRPVPTP